MIENEEDKKDIEIVDGDGSNLDISPVYEDITDIRPKTNDEKPKNIVKELKTESADYKLIYYG